MTISYPLSLPAGGLARVQWVPAAVVAVSESPYTLNTQVQAHQGQRWAAQVALPPMARATAEYWVAFLLSLNGMQGTFLLGDPPGSTPRGTATGTPLVNGAAQTGQTLVTDGWTINITGILKAGDYIQLGSGATARLHKILADANSDGAGNATFDIWPRLRVSPADDDPLTVASCKGVFRLSQNQMAWNINEAIHYGLEFTAIEAI